MRPVGKSILKKFGPRSLTAGALAAALSVWPSLAGGPPEEPVSPIFNRDWNAYTTTAMGITGDVWLTPTSITFDDRVTFKLRFLSEFTSIEPNDWWGKIQEVLLFEFVDPPAQAILNGNHLCGTPRYTPSVPLPRYIAVGLKHLEDRDELLVLVFETETPPNVTREKGLCGTFGYFADHPDPQDN